MLTHAEIKVFSNSMIYIANKTQVYLFIYCGIFMLESANEKKKRSKRTTILGHVNRLNIGIARFLLIMVQVNQ